MLYPISDAYVKILIQVRIQFYWTCSQKAKNQKAKQTIMHCTTKQYNTRQEMKCSAMRCDEKKTMNLGE